MTTQTEIGFVPSRKPAATEASIHELIRERWSPRAFSPEPVSQEEQRSLLEAARWAPSSMNEQPWRFIVADRDRDPETYGRLLSTLMPPNAAWADHAPVLILPLAKTTFTSNNSPNRFAVYDTGAAVALLSLEATARGLRVHQMGGYYPEKARTLLGIPEGFEPLAVLAIGHPGDPSSLSPELRTREAAPRQRRPVEDLLWRLDADGSAVE